MPAVKKIKTKLKKPVRKIKAVSLKKPVSIKKKLPQRTKFSGSVKLKEKKVGVVTHYFSKVRAAVVKVKVPFAVGDKLRLKGHTTDFTQDITSIQVDRTPVNSAKKGQEIGLLVNSRVRQHDIVYKL